MKKGSKKKVVRFDPQRQAFVTASAAYRRVVEEGEDLWRRLQRLNLDPDHAADLRAQLAEVTKELEAKRQALLETTREIAIDPMRTRVKSLLGRRPT